MKKLKTKYLVSKHLYLFESISIYLISEGF